ncbi:hypothetical protein GIB67_008242 [Kingdonia uniflora]|uniref:RBR-type E3 ubiquitin transferase n=1 Tax=Kingdonia uniflora TaxID=39325 RepID=A0A7J7N4Q7_9MAGN|nr:hypothetical protein GIB67_008242 [Kingdonia uniflora]
MGNTQTSLPENSDRQEEGESVESSFTCEICIEPVLSNKKFRNMQKKTCTHPYCVDCISKFIEVKVEENVSEIKCPDPKCDVFLDSLACRSILLESVFVKWCDVLCDSAVLRWERAYCPYPECSALILNECRGKIRKSECPNCKKSFCFKCKIPWHSGYRCEESGEMRDGNDILFGTLAERKKWRRCPTCKHFVERRTGCHAITCRCGTVFCHGCGSKCSSQMCWCKKGRTHSACVLTFMILLLPVIFPVVMLWLIFGSLVPRRLTK